MAENRPGAKAQPSLREARGFWWKLGWISFGGTAAHITVMHDNLAEKKRWISNTMFLHALSHCMILPGPEAQQLAIYIGWKLYGRRGGIVAGTLFVLPSMFVLLALSVIYVEFGNLPWIAAIFGGLKPAVIALVAIAAQRITRRALRGLPQNAVAGATFVAMFFFDVSLPLVMIGAVVLGIALSKWRRDVLPLPAKTAAEGNDDDNCYITLNSAIAEPAPLLNPVAKLTAIAFLLWLPPLSAFYFCVGDFGFWESLVLFFTKTALVTIGGSYTVFCRRAVSGTNAGQSNDSGGLGINHRCRTWRNS